MQGGETMLKFLERLVVMVKIFLRGGWVITEYDSNRNYQKLTRYGFRLWDTYRGYYLTSGTKIILKFDSEVDIFYSSQTEKLYLKGIEDDMFVVYEIEHKTLPEITTKEDYPENQIKQIIESKGYQSFSHIRKFSSFVEINLYNYYHNLIFNYLNGRIIHAGDGLCYYLDVLGIFIISEKPNDWYRVWKPVLDNQGILVSLESTDIILKRKPKDEFGYQVNESEIVCFNRNGDIEIEDSFENISPLYSEIAGIYNYRARKKDEEYLISVGESYKSVRIPGKEIELMFPSASVDELKKYVIIFSESELIIAYIDTEYDSLMEIGRYENGVSVNIKKPIINQEVGGIVIPITVTSRKEEELPI